MAYFYQHQFKKHIIQFAEIFRGLEVRTGVNVSGGIESISVPIIYGSIDRTAAAVLAKNTQNNPLRLPVMSVVMTGLELSTDKFKGIDTEKTMAYTPLGGVFPNDTVTISQVMTIPYKMNLDLHIFSSNNDTRWQILEQILVLFNPSVQIQTSDSKFDGSKITKVDMTGITSGENVPLGIDRRILTDTLSFSVTVYLVAPSQIRDDRIKDIKLRIAKVNDITALPGLAEADFDISNITVEETLV